MRIMFNTLLRKAGFPLCDVRLVRHKGGPTENGHTPYEMWRADRAAFEDYQSEHWTRNRAKLAAPYWAVFVGTDNGQRTLFVGVYGVRRMKKGGGRSWDLYKLNRQRGLGKYIGKLSVDWAAGKRPNSAARAWVQYADRHDKPVIELATESAEE